MAGGHGLLPNGGLPARGPGHSLAVPAGGAADGRAGARSNLYHSGSPAEGTSLFKECASDVLLRSPEGRWTCVRPLASLQGWSPGRLGRPGRAPPGLRGLPPEAWVHLKAPTGSRRPAGGAQRAASPASAPAREGGVLCLPPATPAVSAAGHRPVACSRVCASAAYKSSLAAPLSLPRKTCLQAFQITPLRGEHSTGQGSSFISTGKW